MKILHEIYAGLLWWKDWFPKGTTTWPLIFSTKFLRCDLDEKIDFQIVTSCAPWYSKRNFWGDLDGRIGFQNVFSCIFRCFPHVRLPDHSRVLSMNNAREKMDFEKCSWKHSPITVCVTAINSFVCSGEGCKIGWKAGDRFIPRSGILNIDGFDWVVWDCWINEFH